MDEAEPRKHGFQPGESGNPAGRPKGIRGRTARILDAIGEGSAADIVMAVVRAAKGDPPDMRAADMILARVWPVRKGATVAVDLPPIRTAADLPNAMAAIVQAVASGMLTTDEGASLAGILDANRRAIDTADLEQRIAALENKHG